MADIHALGVVGNLIQLLKKPGLWLSLSVPLAAAAYWGLHPAPLAPVSKVSIAVPTQIYSAPLIVAMKQGLFHKAGVEVINQTTLLGKDALQAVIDGKADLAVAADTPTMFAILGAQDIAIVSGISQSRRALGIVTRNDRGINALQDLSGKSITVTKGTNGLYFLDAMLQVHGIDRSLVNQVDLKVNDGIAAFKEGKVDALAIFQPHLAQLEASMGSQIKVFYGEDVYAFRYLLIGKPAYIDSHPEEIQRILHALLAANAAIRADPPSARSAVGEVVKVNEAILSKLFDPEDFVLSLDQALLLSLDDQTRWAMQQGLVKTGPVPNFLRFTKYQALQTVLPAAVKIVY